MKKTLNHELGRPSAEEFAALPKMEVVVALDNIRSLQNVGSFFRTGDAFAIGSIALCGITATPPNRDIHKTALGAELTVPWQYFATTLQCVEEYKNMGYKVIAIEQCQGSIMLDEFTMEPSTKYLLVFGNEVMGVEQSVVDVADMAIEIPQAGTKHSVNVSVAGGVVLWSLFCQFRTKG